MNQLLPLWALVALGTLSTLYTIGSIIWTWHANRKFRRLLQADIELGRVVVQMKSDFARSRHVEWPHDTLPNIPVDFDDGDDREPTTVRKIVPNDIN